MRKHIISILAFSHRLPLKSVSILILLLVFKPRFGLLNQHEPEHTLRSSCKAFMIVPLSRLRLAHGFFYIRAHRLWNEGRVVPQYPHLLDIPLF